MSVPSTDWPLRMQNAVQLQIGDVLYRALNLNLIYEVQHSEYLIKLWAFSPEHSHRCFELPHLDRVEVHTQEEFLHCEKTWGL
jgi:hypothetical protein